MRRNFPYLFWLIALSIFAVYLYQNIDRYEQLFALTFRSLFLLIGFVLFTIIGLGLVNYLFLRGLSVAVSFNEAVGLSAVSTLANQLPFSGGIVAKSVYLKKRYRLTYTDFVSGTIALYALFVSTDGLLGLGMLTYLGLQWNVFPSPLLILGFSLMAVTALLLLIPLRAPTFIPKKWKQKFREMLQGRQLLMRKSKTLIGLALVHIVVTAVNAGRLWVAFHALSQDITYGQSLLFSAASILTQLFTITPGGLGVREGIVAAVAAAHGIPLDVSVIAVGIDRLVATTVIVGVGASYSYHLSKAATQPHIELDEEEIEEFTAQEASAVMGSGSASHTPEGEGK